MAAEFKTAPNPDQPDRCPSIDPHDTLQCGRRIHEDDQCQYGGIAWKKGTPRHVTAEEQVEELRVEVARLTDLVRVMLGKAAVEGRCGCSSSGEGPLGAMDLAGAVPGVEFARRTQHKRCHEHCVEYLVCPTCSALTHVQTVSGRWDEVERHTARPFDPVAVTLFCGHVFGDMALARPGVAAREAE